MDQVSRECKCTPWALGTDQGESQVKRNNFISFPCITDTWDTLYQVRVMCGPEKECCVGNQTLRDNSCLVPCTGLYADISDDSLRQTMQSMRASEQIMLTGTKLNFYI